MDVTEFINSIPNLADDENREPATVYRVWAKAVDGRWFAVSRAFKAEHDAHEWALDLNLDHRMEAEDET